ncbi:uncharacterized protein LOC119603466 [Lucilia sericata]|nr:uncharacterized protein LOC119603466 [Lucilia sericata]
MKKKAEREIRRNCVKFVVDLINQLKQRLPDNIKILQNIEYFSVDNVLKSSKEDILPILNLFHVDDEISLKIQEQYSNIHYIKWKNTNNTISFWTEVYKYRDAGGNKKFNEISEFVLKLLSLPWSNAEVERVFSQINLVKTYLRNKMHLSTVTSILSIRFGLKRIDKCCFEYDVPNNYLKLVGTSESYDKNNNIPDFIDDLFF